MDEVELPETFWCGGRNGLQDVSIHLQEETGYGSRKTLAVVKVHSHRLKKNSKYFETYLSEMWVNAKSSTTSMEFTLEVVDALQVADYVDCFSRMYTPFRKDFKDVKSSVNLLRVASWIEFPALMSSICRYLSNIVWSVEDELRIREFSSSVDFPRSEAADLVARLEFGSESDDHGRDRVSELIKKCMLSALLFRDNPSIKYPFHEVRNARALLAELTQRAEKDLLSTISRVAAGLLFDIQGVYLQQGDYNEADQEFHQVPLVSGYDDDLEGVCWILEVLLEAKVAGEVVEGFLRFKHFPNILRAAVDYFCVEPIFESGTIPVVVQFAKIVSRIYQEVAAGNLLLDMEHREALLLNWPSSIFVCGDPLSSIDKAEWGFEQADVRSFEQAIEGVILTLPFERHAQFVCGAEKSTT